MRHDYKSQYPLKTLKVWRLRVVFWNSTMLHLIKNVHPFPFSYKYMIDHTPNKVLVLWWKLKNKNNNKKFYLKKITQDFSFFCTFICTFPHRRGREQKKGSYLLTRIIRGNVFCYLLQRVVMIMKRQIMAVR